MLWATVVVLAALLCPVKSQPPLVEEDGPPQGAATLAFVFDITGSMYDDLVQVIEGAAKILNTILERRETSIYNYVLVPFHDPEIGPVTVTTDPEVFQQHLRDLYVQGGGDCPEMSVGAIKLALDVCLPNSYIYVFTDARSKDYYLLQEVLTLVQRKESQIVFVMTGDCGNTSHPGYQAYEQIASTSSGQVFQLKKTDVDQVLNFVRVSLQARKVNLIALDHDKQFSHDIELLVDSSLREFTVSVSGDNPFIRLIDPSGQVVEEANGLLNLLSLKNVKIVNIKEPIPGKWRVQVASDSAHSIRSTGLSSLNFIHGFSISPTPNFVETYHRPLKGAPTHLIVNATDIGPSGHFDHVELLDLKGNIINAVSLHPVPEATGLFNASTFVPPDEYFYIKVIGQDANGHLFQRISSTAINAQLPAIPEVNMKSEIDGYFSKPVTILCYVQSLVPFSVQWFRGKNAEILVTDKQDYSQTNEVTYTIPSVKMEHEDTYWCSASNAAGPSKASVFLDVKEPPPTIETPQNVTVAPNKDAWLSCITISPVDFNVSWSRYVHDLAKPHFSRSLVMNNPRSLEMKNGSVIIHDVIKEDEGWYRCTAMNEGGASHEHLYLQVQDPPKVQINPSSLTFQKGSRIEVHCEGTGFPEPRLFWVLGEEFIGNFGRRRIEQSNFIIEDAQREDEAVYECVAQNEAGVDRKQVALSYIEKPQIKAVESRILSGRGDRTTFHCEAQGTPVPYIRWYKEEKELYPLSFIEISSDRTSLSILGTQEADAGTYRCTASNKAGEEEDSILLEVGSSPHIIHPPTDTRINVEKNGHLLCEAEGFPQPDITWLRRDGTPMDWNRFSILETGHLHVKAVAKNDEGIYVCRAENRFGHDLREASIIVTGIVPPLLKLSSSSVDVKRNAPVSLPCTVIAGNPAPKLKWFRNNRLVDNTDGFFTDENGSLTLSSAEKHHQGDYLCLAENVGGNATQHIFLNVQIPPTISLDNEKDIIITEGDHVILPCNVQGDPKPIITWQKNGMILLPTNRRYKIRKDDSLEILSASENDIATYICTAVNVAGVTNKAISLFVQVPPKILADKSEFKVLENEEIVLPCQVHAVPPAIITWQKNGIHLEPNNVDVTELNSGGLKFTAQLTDAGQYLCEAENPVGKDSKVLSLTVTVPPSISPGSPDTQTAIKGDNVIFYCHASGFPPPTIYWLLNNNEIIEEHLNNPTQGTLTLNEVFPSDSGIYTCLAKNEVGMAKVDFQLTVYDPPEIDSATPSSINIIEDNEVTIYCLVTGFPEPSVSWWKNGQELNSAKPGFEIRKDNSLYIKNTQVEDDGTYTCIARNAVGNDSLDVKLNVLVPPRFDHVFLKDNLAVTLGGTLILECPVRAYPPPILVWYKDGNILNEENSFEYGFLDGKQKLKIFNASEEDAGKYSCQAANSVGEIQNDFQVSVFVPPWFGNPNLHQHISVVENQLLHLDCEVFGNPFPELAWTKDGEIYLPSYVPGVKTSPDGFRVSIEKSQLADSGIYKCTASSKAGEATKVIEVNVLVPPHIKGVPLENVEVIRGSSTILKCPAFGFPVPDIHWSHNGQPIIMPNLLSDNGRQLNLENIAITDAGQYVCSAVNEAGQAEKEIMLDVLVPPLIEDSISAVTVKTLINERLALECKSDGNPFPVFTWLKDNLPIHVGTIASTTEYPALTHFKIDSVQESDKGKYTCTATNKAGSSQKDFLVDILVPPQFDGLVNGTEGKETVVHQSAAFHCFVSGNPPPSIVWLKDNQLLDITAKHLVVSERGQSLRILHANTDDAGFYTCVAQNEAGDINRNFSLSVWVPPNISNISSDRIKYVKRGDDLILQCIVTGDPDPEITWLKDGHSIPNKAVASDTLTVESVTTEDGGRYTCIATNIAGSAERDVEVDILVPPTLQQLPPGAQSELQVRLNRPISLECLFTGNPTPEIHWLKNGTRIDLSDNHVHLSTDKKELQILRTKIEDANIYSCIAENSIGKEKLDFNISVLVPPRIDTQNIKTKLKIKENQTISLHCPSSGNPEPIVTWLKDGQLLVPELNQRVELDKNDQEINILQSSLTDGGKYICLVSNEAGSTEQEFKVEIQVPPKSNKGDVNDQLEVIESRPITIPCLVGGIPPPTIKWLKDGNPLGRITDPNLSLSADGKKLKIRRARKSDTGLYTCLAVNEVGSWEKDFRLTVQVPPTIKSDNESDDFEEDAEIIAIEDKELSLECLVDGFPEPSVFWLKDGRVLSSDGVTLLNNNQVFKLENVQITDSGHYTCVATNVAGTSEKDFEVNVYVAPKFPPGFEGNIPPVLVNRPFSIVCPVQGNPKPSIIWLKDGVPLNTSADNSFSATVVNGGQQLHVLRASPENQGIYSCQAENEVGSIKKEYPVEIQIPPFIDSKEVPSSVIEGGSVSLECHVTGNPAPTITWLKDGDVLEQEDYQELDLKIQKKGQVVILNSAKLENNGRYSCIASSEAGTAEKDFNINVIVPPKIKKSNDETSVTAIANRGVVLECIVETESEVMLHWLKDEIALETSTNPFLQLVNGGQRLHLLRVQDSDSGEYQCIAMNQAGQDEIKYQLNVLVPPIIENDDDFTNRYLEGKDIDIECFVVGNPFPNITWFKDGKEVEVLEPGKTFLASDNQILQISQAHFSDSGLYSCLAINEVGSAQKHFEILVHVPPTIITDTSPTLSVVINHPVLMRCNATGHPQPIITWLKNGYPVDSLNEANAQILEHGKEFSLKRTRIADVGKYTCIAINTAGQDERTFSLSVHIPPHIDRSNLVKSVTVIKNNTGYLECSVVGNPAPNITWYHNGNELFPDVRVQILNHGQQVRINQAQREDIGEYQCVAQNEAGTDKEEIILKVLSPPVVQDGLTLLQVEEGEPVAVICPVEAPFPPAITWFKNGHLFEEAQYPHIELMNSDVMLKIMHALASDDAIYKCIASNVAGEVEVDIRVNVLVPPRMVNSSNDRLHQVTENHTASLECIVNGNPFPSISWMKNGIPLTANFDDYTDQDNFLGDDAWRYGGRPKVDDTGDGPQRGDVSPLEDYDYEVAVPNPNIKEAWRYKGLPLGIDGGRNSQVPQVPYERISIPQISNQGGEILKFPRVKLDDNGTYTCVAFSEVGLAKKDFHLQVLIPPVINGSIVDRNPSVILNDEVTLSCPSSGIPSPRVIWYKDGKLVLPGGKFSLSPNGQDLTIRKAHLSDGGVYICMAVNEAGDSEVEITLNVLVPPTIEDMDKITDVQVIVRQSVTIECPIHGIPQPVVSWLKNNEVLEKNERIFQKGQFLEITQALREDEATYTCVAENDVGIVDKDFKLDVLVPPGVDADEVDVIDISVGQPLSIECPASGEPRPMVSWLKNGQPVNPSDHLQLIEDDYILWINSALPSDAAEYTCIAKNDAGISEKNFAVRVLVPPVFDERNPENISVIMNRPFHIECKVKGIPIPEVMWSKDGKSLETDKNTIVNGPLLQVFRSNPDHSGKYICSAANIAGNSTKIYTVNVHEPPKLKQGTAIEEITVINNEPLTLLCEPLGNPRPTITWFKDNLPVGLYLENGGKISLGNQEKFSIVAVQMSDSGRYKCLAANIAGNVSKEFDVSVLVPPYFEDMPSEIGAVVGETVLLPCSVAGDPRPQITWKRDNDNLSGFHHKFRQTPSGELELKNVDLQDEGTYMCSAQNTAGSVENAITLQVRAPPTIADGPAVLSVISGQPITLPCEASGYPRPLVTWRRGDEILVDLEDFEIQPTGSLVIISTSIKDSGIYTCLAHNEAGNAHVQRKLQVMVIPTTTEESYVEHIAFKGKEVVLECDVSGWPIPAVTWKLNGFPVKQVPQRIMIMPNGALRFASVRPEDSGEYVCTATNEAGTTTQEHDLTVYAPPTLDSEELTKVNAVVGGLVKLPCKAYGFPLPQVSWMHNGKNLTSEKSQRLLLESSGDMVIMKVQAGDAGKYICVAGNEAGKVSKEIVLDVHLPPNITKAPTDQDVILNEKFSLTCGSEGNPEPSITWFLNNTELPNSPIPVKGQSTLVVESASKDDSGTYTCVAKNGAGEQKSSAKVTLKIPPVIKTPPGTQVVRQNDKVVLNCEAIGDPQPLILWTKNGERLKLNERMRQSFNGSLTIYIATNEDAGDYKCIASNAIGAAEADGKVVIRTEPVFLITPVDTVATSGETVFFHCRAGGEPEPAVKWYREGQEILTSDNQISILPNTSLRIVAVQPSDEDLYVCIAKNPLGSAVSKAQLTVRVHGVYSSWQQWSHCSTTCGAGVQTRYRKCDNPAPRNEGRDCIGPDSDSIACELRKCPVDGFWGNWGDWSDCSSSCGKGIRVRTRNCNNPFPQFGGRLCEGEALDEDECTSKMCPVDGGWSDWNEWSSCSTTCGEGIQERLRLCNNPYPQNDGVPCDGPTVETKYCNQGPCEINGEWSGWSQWSLCSHSCGGGTRQRQRACDSPPPSIGGKQCTGSDVQLDFCNNDPCPVHGNWGAWSTWGECSASCNRGYRRRFRTCNNPPPSNGGRGCSGPSQSNEACNTHRCPEDGNWASWSEWSSCSVTCGVGNRERFRSCSDPPPRFGGRRCSGDANQLEECSAEPCVDFPSYAIGNLIGLVNGEDVGLSTVVANITKLGPHRTVMATINNMPPEAANWLRPLVSILSPVYWSVGNEIGQSMNGHSLTKGFFRRDSQVNFATGEVLKMTHVARGLDPNGALLVDVVLSGEVPHLPEDAEITLDPYTEDYVQSGPGSLYGFSTRTFRVNGHMLPYAWNHTTHYDDSQGRMPYLVQRLHANGIGVHYNPDSQELSFITSSSVSKGNPSNKCPPGFNLDPDGPYCKDDNECDQLQVCSHGCINSPGSYACVCPSGFQLEPNGHQCKDIDECQVGLAICKKHEECQNTLGSYKCLVKCSTGYIRNPSGNDCEDINECIETPKVCEQECRNVAGSYRCDCMKGYQLLGKSRCVDVDECNQPNRLCSHSCQNTVGSFICSCPTGFQLLSGRICKDIDECATKPCQSDQECYNSIGSYECLTICPQGYRRMENGSCIDVDECLSATNLCHYSQVCENFPGGYRCNCMRGFQSAGPGQPCYDYDECETENVCQHECQNTIGSYKCICPKGYRLSSNGRTCTDIDECTEEAIDCGSERMCFNTRGSYQCVDTPCPPDYIRDTVTGYCKLECEKSEVPCAANVRYSEILAFKMVALPSGIQAYQDLIRLAAYDQDGQHLPNTVFGIIENETGIPFRIRLEHGKGVLYTLRALDRGKEYSMKVQAVSYDSTQTILQYTTKFMVFISVSEYPY